MSVMMRVQGLTPNTDYVVRVIVINNSTQQVSMEQSFSTPGKCARVYSYSHLSVLLIVFGIIAGELSIW